MDQSIIALIIIGLAIVSFALEKIPLGLTAVLASLAMGIFGIIDFPKVYSDFGSLPTIMVVGMMIVSDACFENGVAQTLGDKLTKIGLGKNERLCTVVMCALACLLSAFLSNSAVVAMLIPVVASIVVKSKGKLQNKYILMSVGMGAAAGGFCTLAGSTPQLVAQGILMETEGLRPMGFFELALVGIPLCALMVLYFGTVGYALEKKVLKFPDVIPGFQDTTAAQPTDEKVSYVKWKMLLTTAVLLGCIAGFVSGIWNIAVVAMLGAAILMVTGCIPWKKAFQNIDWNTILCVAACQGFAAGLDKSGAGALIADKTLALFGANATPMVLLGALFVVSVVLTNFMSNVSVCTMILPIAISLAQSVGANPVSYVLAIVIACQIAFATPIGTACVTQTLVGGYHYKDYVKIGLPITVIMTIAGIVLIPIVYGI